MLKMRVLGVVCVIWGIGVAWVGCADSSENQITGVAKTNAGTESNNNPSGMVIGRGDVEASGFGTEGSTGVCGDAVCGVDETSVNCPLDCGEDCGDGACNGSETSGQCPEDCGGSEDSAKCGDGSCADGEDSVTCVQDCGSYCSDGACNGSETAENCPKDCGKKQAPAQCGDGGCEGDENSVNCVEDCGSVCSDGACNGDETPATCPKDCGTPPPLPLCGDGECKGEENSKNCVPDCGATCGDGACNGNELNSNCPEDCGSKCGDGVCAPGVEDCGTCLGDCPCAKGKTCVAHACEQQNIDCEPGTCESLGIKCGFASDGCDGELNCGPCSQPKDCKLPPLSAPAVGVQDNSLVDNQGPYLGLGASLFWAAWAYKYDKPKLEKNLQFLSSAGFNYIRALGVVGDTKKADYWDGREIDFNWPDYDKVIAGVTDLAFEKYGLRVQWSLIGDGQVTVPTKSERYALADTFLAMSKGREHKIVLLETANEYWLNGFPGSQGLKDLRELTQYLRSKTDILVAASAPAGHECDDAKAIYDGCVADIATIHFDRDISKVEGSWRPVRQPWEHQYCGVPVGSNNEPIGPGSSVNTENNPLKIVSGAIVSYISGLPMHVFHSNAGVRGFSDIESMAGAKQFAKVMALLPNDLSSWKQVNAHWSDSPFKVFAGNKDGSLEADKMWVDLNGPVSGVVRSYGAIKGKKFVAYPMGIIKKVIMEPRKDMDVAIINPLNGVTTQCLSLKKGTKFTLSGGAAFLLKGSYWCNGAPCAGEVCKVSEPGCGDNVCAPGKENCESCPGDCPCAPGTSCKNNQCVAPSGGPVCGDKQCAPGKEDCGTCPGDCPCAPGTSCKNNQCVASSGPVCGDKKCAPGKEDCGSCPGDCPCAKGTVCNKHQCVAPTGSGSEEDDDLPDDFAGVIRLHKDVAQQKQTAKLITVSIDGPMLCSGYNKAGIWPGYGLSAITIVNGHAQIFDWMNAEQAWC